MGHRELLGVHLLANKIPRISLNQSKENTKSTIKKNTFSRAGVGQHKIDLRLQLHVGAISDYFFDGRPNVGNDTEYEGVKTESRQSISQD